MCVDASARHQPGISQASVSSMHSAWCRVGSGVPDPSKGVPLQGPPLGAAGFEIQGQTRGCERGRRRCTGACTVPAAPHGAEWWDGVVSSAICDACLHSMVHSCLRGSSCSLPTCIFITSPPLSHQHQHNNTQYLQHRCQLLCCCLQHKLPPQRLGARWQR